MLRHIGSLSLAEKGLDDGESILVKRLSRSVTGVPRHYA